MGAALMIAILVGGIVVGLLDLGAAALINGVNPLLICRAVARGVLGKAAMHGGMIATALGFALQGLMSILIAAIYGAASLWLPMLSRQWQACGLAYGVGVFFVMNYVVVPLSAVRKIPHFTALSFSENMLAMLVFCLIVAFAIHRGVAQAPVV